MTGWNGADTSSSQRPNTTSAPAAWACAATSVASRVFPMPGSPSTHNRRAEDVAALVDDVARGDPDADRHRCGGARRPRVAVETLLDGDGGVEGHRGGMERGEDAVARSLHHRALVLSDALAQQPV